MKHKIPILLIGTALVFGIIFFISNKEEETREEEREREVELYFYNEIEDMELTGAINCSPEAILPVTRKIQDSRLIDEVIKNTINLLLSSPNTFQESMEGFSTEFPLEGFELESLHLSGEGVLTLTFNDVPSASGGSCRVGILSTQIVKTALQFNEVREVIILPETIFQP